MKIPKLRLRRQRIGVIGLYRSGKTVFLTSLINHLRSHRPDRFLLGHNAKLIFDHAPRPTRFDPFPYDKHRAQMVAGLDWPEKTRGVSEYIGRYYRSDWHLSCGELSLLDFPGERLADLTMVNASFEQWSELMLTIFRQQPEYAGLAAGYLEQLDAPALTESSLTAAYQRLLVSCFEQYRPLISPSTVLISPTGHWHKDAPPPVWEGLPAPHPKPPASDRTEPEGCYCGLDAETQFAPLSAEARRRNPAIHKRFARHYRTYRHKIAVPLADWMRGCQALVVLVDVTALLEGGQDMYQGNRELIRHLIDLLQPGQGYFGLSLDVLRNVLSPFDNRPLAPLTRHSLWPREPMTTLQNQILALIHPDWNCISRIAFVATKADKVHASDRDKLRDLVREMTGPIIDKRQMQAARLNIGYFACAAVNSTRAVAPNRLQAYLGPDRKPFVYTPSQVPQDWPPAWQAGQFRFPNVKPWIPPLRDIAPDHIDLDRVADFLMR